MSSTATDVYTRGRMQRTFVEPRPTAATGRSLSRWHRCRRVRTLHAWRGRGSAEPAAPHRAAPRADGGDAAADGGRRTTDDRRHGADGEGRAGPLIFRHACSWHADGRLDRTRRPLNGAIPGFRHRSAFRTAQ
jgi:hypothetical protein